MPPVPTEPGEYRLSADGKAWELDCPAAAPVCAAEPVASASPALLPPGDL
jgi:hypothetical protein